MCWIFYISLLLLLFKWFEMYDYCLICVDSCNVKKVSLIFYWDLCLLTLSQLFICCALVFSFRSQLISLSFSFSSFFSHIFFLFFCINNLIINSYFAVFAFCQYFFSIYIFKIFFCLKFSQIQSADCELIDHS